jgi:peptide/nickel transport system ATP-binding protein
MVDPPDRSAGQSHVAACLHSHRTAGIESPDIVAARPIDFGETLARLDLAGKRFRVPGRPFRRASEVWAVRDATFEIKAGEFVGLVGESGSGKSTVARLIMGLERATKGRIVLAAVTSPARLRPTGSTGCSGRRWCFRIRNQR